MKKSLDPRVRFFYYKNGFNSKVIQSFIDTGKKESLPPFVLENINLDADGNFESYKVGEPWCRYEGIPIVWNMGAEYDSMLGVYFETADRYQVTIGDAKKSYSLFSGLNEEMIRGRVDFTLPTIPGGPNITDTEDVPWWGLYLGAGETNLYLAELAQLGAISGNAKNYYERGVELSVKEWDYVAGKNKIPYYGTNYGYDPLEESIELKDGEIAAMLATGMGPIKILNAWGAASGFWSLLAFSMQMALVLVLGSAMASAKPVNSTNCAASTCARHKQIPFPQLNVLTLDEFNETLK